MTATARLLATTDPARRLGPQLDERAEAELAALVGAAPAAGRSGSARPGSRRPGRRILVTGLVAAVVVAATVAVLRAAPDGRGEAAAPTTSSSVTPRAATRAVDLVRAVWHVEGADGEGVDTWLRFAAHDVRLIRGASALELGWRAQGDQLLISPDGPAGSRTARWLEATSAFRADGTGFDLLDGRGAVTARLVARNDPPAPPAAVDSIVRDSLADARPGPVRRIRPTALRGSWRLEGVPRSTAQVTFHDDGSWTTTERCSNSEGPETDSGGSRLLESGVLLVTVRTGQSLACQEQPIGGDSISTIELLLGGRSVRLDGDTATLYDVHGSRLARLIRL